MFKIGLLTGLLTALLVLCTAPASADPQDWIAARGPIACKWMDMHPDLYGSLSTMRTMEDEGVAEDEIPHTLGSVIATFCPNHADLYTKTRQYLTHGGGMAIIGGGV
ncbi:MAG TPA: hypothetical protein VFR17_01855 [Mycobacterium sp.]|nr:hypothetical protein [Mycobacterium sp.]